MKFTKLAVAILLVGSAVTAYGAVVNTGNVYDEAAVIADKEANRSGNLPYDGGFVGGENIGNAVAIGALPFADGGNTCGYNNDYDEVCPYTGSTSGDVVYSITPGSDVSIEIDLCNSLYDTKVYVYGPGGALVACNDDYGCGFSGYQSHLDCVSLVAPNTYYIVIDGWLGECGDYDLTIAECAGPQPCTPCPAAAQLEGEPDCFDGYVDHYNGGCNSQPPVYTEITCPTICGKAGTYIFNGLSYRDTDWYHVNLPAGSYSITGQAEWDLRLFDLGIPGGNCGGLVIDNTVNGGNCTPITMNFPGGDQYFFAGPNFFSGLTCGSDYQLTFSGDGFPNDCGGVPTVETSWGQLKGLYRN